MAETKKEKMYCTNCGKLVDTSQGDCPYCFGTSFSNVPPKGRPVGKPESLISAWKENLPGAKF